MPCFAFEGREIGWREWAGNGMVQLRARNDVVQRGIEGREDGGWAARSKKERMIRKTNEWMDGAATKKQENDDDAQQAGQEREK